MLAHESKETPALRQALDELARLRRFSGPPAEFWPAFMAAAGNLIGACRGMLILRDPAQPDRLKKLSDWSSNGHADRAVITFTRMVGEIAQQCAADGVYLRAIENGPTPESKHFALALVIPLPAGAEACIAAFLLLNATEAQAQEA